MAAARSVRIMVVDHDARVHRLFERALPSPEFELHVFEDPCAALVDLQALDPDIVVCADKMPGIEAGDFVRGIRATGRYRDLVFLVLANNPLSRREVELVLGPRDACLLKPVPVPSLLQRLRQVSPRESPPQRGGLSGHTDRHGLLGLLKLCEDARLTGRFRLESRGREVWVDWLAGTPVASGARPEEKDRSAHETLLELESGRYAFEPQPVEAGKDGGGPRGAFAASGSGMAGRFSVVEKDTRRYQVYTEAFHAPNFTVTTVVAVFGQGLRKIDTVWPHPMKRDADADAVREQVEQQHERVLQLVQDGGLVPASRRKIWDVAGGGVEGSILVWVMSLLREMVRERIGLVPTIGLLRQSRRELLAGHVGLKGFNVDEAGHITVRSGEESTRATLTGFRLPKGAVEGIAAWATLFRAEAALLAGSPRLPSVRRATRMLAEDLERVGFYAALEEDSRARV
ncbi:MAG TPA: response regulator [Vicinamibacteria bacterium]|nr:response regulator [Vicinamibacteria bacterium]